MKKKHRKLIILTSIFTAFILVVSSLLLDSWQLQLLSIFFYTLLIGYIHYIKFNTNLKNKKILSFLYSIAYSISLTSFPLGNYLYKNNINTTTNKILITFVPLILCSICLVVYIKLSKKTISSE